MDAVEYLKQKSRACESYRDKKCVGCPLFYISLSTCGNVEKFRFEEAVEAVEKWAKEHPLKTYKIDLLEKYPKCRMFPTGIPQLCRDVLHGNEKVCDRKNCTDCWNEPMPEVTS